MKKYSKKTLTLLVCAALVLCIAVGGTLAYLIAGTGSITNTFAASRVDCEVQTGNTIMNTGDTDAYIRAAVVVTWRDGNNVYGKAPAATISPGDGWLKGNDGYYYYNTKVAVGATTTALTATPNETAPSGYTFTVEILAEAIQWTPDEAFNSAWGASSGLTANNGKLKTTKGGTT